MYCIRMMYIGDVYLKSYFDCVYMAVKKIDIIKKVCTTI